MIKRSPIALAAFLLSSAISSSLGFNADFIRPLMAISSEHSGSIDSSDTQRSSLGQLLKPNGISHDHLNQIHVPEPLLFDLVRPLGARKGELEFNTLVVMPWRKRNRNPSGGDPFGSGPNTPDRRSVEWAPEIEYAPTDNFAIEFEFPFEDSILEEYKLGLQWTFDQNFSENYIHGLQILVEPTIHWRDWNTTLVYLAGYRFNETWSTLAMIGGRMNLEGSNRDDSVEALLNLSIFADVHERAKLGLELNYAQNLTKSPWQFIAVPQVHYDIEENVQLQTGLGFGVFQAGFEYSVIGRLIFEW